MMRAIIVVILFGNMWCSKPMNYRHALEVQFQLNNKKFAGTFGLVRQNDRMYATIRKECQELTGF
jgi:hypothetical protein